MYCLYWGNGIVTHFKMNLTCTLEKVDCMVYIIDIMYVHVDVH